MTQLLVSKSKLKKWEGDLWIGTSTFQIVQEILTILNSDRKFGVHITQKKLQCYTQ